MIVCFTGTGNSGAVALRLSRTLDDELVMLRGDLLTCATPELVLSGDRVVWVFPTYSWGVPPVVADFIGRVAIEGDTSDAVHYMVTTCGDDIGRADVQWARLVERRGWKAGGRWSVQMPNTYVCMKGFDVDRKPVEQGKLALMSARVDRIASAIASCSTETDVTRGSWSRFKTSVIYPWFKRFEMSPGPFRVSDKCIGCGECERGCPTCNITLDEVTHKPVWSDRCALCLRCYHYCPVNAIAYGKTTLGKGQYRCPEDS